MESFLNLLWLLLALLSFGLWRMKWSQAGWGRGRRRNSLRGAIGLSCVLVLLFFAISLTDDLHEIPALAEDTSSPCRPLRVWKASPIGTETSKHPTPFTGMDLSKLFCQADKVVGRVIPTDAVSPRTTSKRSFEGRAPPTAVAVTL